MEALSTLDPNVTGKGQNFGGLGFGGSYFSCIRGVLCTCPCLVDTCQKRVSVLCPSQRRSVVSHDKKTVILDVVTWLCRRPPRTSKKRALVWSVLSAFQFWPTFIFLIAILLLYSRLSPAVCRRIICCILFTYPRCSRCCSFCPTWGESKV